MKGQIDGRTGGRCGISVYVCSSPGPLDCCKSVSDSNTHPPLPGGDREGVASSRLTGCMAALGLLACLLFSRANGHTQREEKSEHPRSRRPKCEQASRRERAEEGKRRQTSNTELTKPSLSPVGPIIWGEQPKSSAPVNTLIISLFLRTKPQQTHSHCWGAGGHFQANFGPQLTGRPLHHQSCKQQAPCYVALQRPRAVMCRSNPIQAQSQNTTGLSYMMSCVFLLVALPLRQKGILVAEKYCLPESSVHSGNRYLTRPAHSQQKGEPRRKEGRK